MAFLQRADMEPTVRRSPEEEAKHLAAQELKRLNELDDLKFVLSSPQGVRFFKRFFDEGSMFKTTFTGSSQGMFLEGHRNFALKFFHDICEACPEKIPELIMRGELKK